MVSHCCHDTSVAPGLPSTSTSDEEKRVRFRHDPSRRSAFQQVPTSTPCLHLRNLPWFHSIIPFHPHQTGFCTRIRNSVEPVGLSEGTFINVKVTHLALLPYPARPGREDSSEKRCHQRMERWEKKGWTTIAGRAVLHQPMVVRLNDLVSGQHSQRGSSMYREREI